MRDLSTLLVHLIAIGAKIVRPGGMRAVVAESLLLKHQLLILNRSRRRAPNLNVTDRVIAGFLAALIRPARLLRTAVVLKPSTILQFHRALVQRKYRLLFSPKQRGKPGPKGPSQELIEAIVQMKQRNPQFGSRRIAQQLSITFGIDLDKDIVRRVLAKHYRPKPGSGGPSWLTFLGHTKDSLWSADLFRCESLWLKTHWVMIVMDQHTRRIVGFAVQPGTLDGPTVCRMLSIAIAAAPDPPRYLSSDNDPLFRFHRWKANLRVLDVSEIKTIPHVPLSHPFVERLIGTVRREFLDQAPFWNAGDLTRKLRSFRTYYNQMRPHQGINGKIPDADTQTVSTTAENLSRYRWERICRGLYQLPIPA